MGRAVSYISDLHYERLTVDTQLWVDLGLDLVLGALLIYIDMLLSAFLSYTQSI